MTRPFIPCTVKQLHPTVRVEAAKTAVRINPANATAARAAASLGITAPEHLALLTSKYWGPAGVKLTVSFLDNPDAATRTKIVQHMNAWGARANVTFVQTTGSGQVRIARANSGYWSYLGTDVLSIPAGEATMNLQGFDAASTPDSEFYRVVRHETGHTLGFPHEHERPEIVALLDEQKTLAYFERTQGWSAQDVQQQVLTPLTGLDPRSLPSDVRSIMCYELPGEITKNGQAIPGGTDINEEDYQLAATLYPKSTTGGGGGGNPPPPQPPPPPVSGRLFTLTFGREVHQGRRIVFATPVAIPAGTYDVVPEKARYGNEGWELASYPRADRDPHFPVDYYLCQGPHQVPRVEVEVDHG